ncbi:ABC transporter related [Desulfofarcimen acetoxidans DSM 771]|uniref:ABC transporter related n=1 Tax=Desulfofarcimen acetoxidans (strain ATCC 49208 / DSM 771 / KCTC 5769 / VKM B-1644 / 5575) TaxID=485916 RepID=C8VX58_DESAS|nr:ABC transporter ATP-binding protein [Desulfofarcimen acetoxidans]ACV62634.1 ABC transporter related [Desulfofarcimen acetoxidans DSM 771]
MITISGLSKKFGKQLALDQVSFSIKEGKVFGLIGPNGAGKTTAMSILATLLLPDSGTVEVNGYNVLLNPGEVRQMIGYMPDFFGVYDGLKVTEYLEFFADAFQVPENQKKTIISDLLELVNLSVKADFYVDTLSRGMKQRLALARCLVHDPKVLILDEPASGLDPRARAEMKEIVYQLKQMNKTVLISSHILPELAEMCDEVAIMEKGRLVANGPVAEITSAASGMRHLIIEVLERGQELVALVRARDKVNQVQQNENLIKLTYSGTRAEQGNLLKEISQEFLVLQFYESKGDLERLFMSVTGEVN